MLAATVPATLTRKAACDRPRSPGLPQLINVLMGIRDTIVSIRLQLCKSGTGTNFAAFAKLRACTRFAGRPRMPAPTSAPSRERKGAEGREGPRFFVLQ